MFLSIMIRIPSVLDKHEQKGLPKHEQELSWFIFKMVVWARTLTSAESAFAMGKATATCSLSKALTYPDWWFPK